MSNNGKLNFLSPLLLGTLAGAISNEKLLVVKSILVTADGPMIHALDEDGKNLLIAVEVVAVAEDDVPRIHEYTPTS